MGTVQNGHLWAVSSALSAAELQRFLPLFKIAVVHSAQTGHTVRMCVQVPCRSCLRPARRRGSISCRWTTLCRRSMACCRLTWWRVSTPTALTSPTATQTPLEATVAAAGAGAREVVPATRGAPATPVDRGARVPADPLEPISCRQPVPLEIVFLEGDDAAQEPI